MMVIIKKPLKPGDSTPQPTARVPFDADAYLRFSDALRWLHLRIRMETLSIEDAIRNEAEMALGLDVRLDRGLPRSLWQLLFWDSVWWKDDREEIERVFAEDDRIVIRWNGDTEEFEVLSSDGRLLTHLTEHLTSEVLFNCWMALEVGLEPAKLEDALRRFPGFETDPIPDDTDPRTRAVLVYRDRYEFALRMGDEEPLDGLMRAGIRACEEAEETGEDRWLDGSELKFGPNHPRGPWISILFEGTREQPRRREAKELLRWLRQTRRVQLDAHADGHGNTSVLLVDQRPGTEPRIMGEIPRDAIQLVNRDIYPRLLAWRLFELGVGPESLDRLRKSFPASTADEVHPDLLDPHYFDTNPDDTGRKYLPSEEYGWRNRHRRESFERLLGELTSAFDLTFDEYDWSTDEASEGYDIPLSQLRDVVELIKSLGFDYEANEDPYGDYCAKADDDEETKLWIHDPVVMKLIPEGYNCYTLRAPE